MNTYRPLRGHRAFTLIELLVVITILALLVSLAVPAINKALDRARRLDARHMAQGLTLAVNNYRNDYNRLPVRAGAPADTEIELSSGSSLLKILLGENVDRLNPQTFSFLGDIKMGSGGAGGLVGQNGSFSLVDPWGQCYRMVLDANSDNRVANPDAKNADPGVSAEAPQMLQYSVIAFSAGPDKKFGTADDVVSWR